MKVIVGVSGGADSVCLLRILDGLKDDLDLKLICVHIEHGIRGAQSRDDRDFVRDLCKDMGVDLKIYEEDVPRIADEMSMTLEEAGRYVRYKAFRKELEDNGADVIAVAHHKGDQAETVIFNMIRGSGLKGLSGMAPSNDRIIRPLLNVSRQEIEGYLSSIGQDHCTDITNSDNGYTRNCIRNNIIPELEGTVTGASDHIIRVADEIREADDYIREQAAPVYEEAVTVKEGLYRIDIETMRREKPIIRRYVIRKLLTDLYTSHKDLEDVHVRSVEDLINKQSGRSVDLPRGIRAKREGNTIRIGREQDLTPDREKLSFPLEMQGITDIPGYGTFRAGVFKREAKAVIPDSLYTKWFDYDKIINGAQVRTRESGDYLTIGRDENKKKLKNYLIDEKVPASSRDGLLLLADGPHIIWVVGMRISEHYKVDEGTQRILEITYTDKEKENG